MGTLGQLASSEENQLSRTIQACFEHSPFVRHQMLELLRNVCGIQVRPPASEPWECAVEVQTPRPGGGRVDIRIGPARASDSLPIFYLESKVESPLTFEQLKRYRRHGVQYLVAVTKYPPEISRKVVSNLGASVFRWQDLRRRLREGNPRNSDRFIAQSLADYLEELGMAYREDLRLKDLERCRCVLNAVASPKGRRITPRNGFEVADACLNMLRDVRDRFIELHPNLAAYHTFGPGFETWFEDDHERFQQFYCACSKGKYSKAHFGCRILFPENLKDPLLWCLWLGGTAVRNERYEEWPLKSMFSRDRKLDQKKLVDSLNLHGEQWGFVRANKSRQAILG